MDSKQGIGQQIRAFFKKHFDTWKKTRHIWIEDVYKANNLGLEVNPFVFSADRKKPEAKYEQQPDSEPKTETNRATDRNRKKAEIQRLEAASRCPHFHQNGLDKMTANIKKMSRGLKSIMEELFS
jgi:hypothetical protein